MPSNTTFVPSSIAQFTSDKVHFCGLYATGTASHGTTTPIDLQLTDDMLVTGGIFTTKNGVWGDTVILQVVDVDNVIGYGPGTILNQFVSWILPDSPTNGIQIQLSVPYPAKVPAGLYLRVSYTSVGSVDVLVSMNYMLHKVMV